MKSVSPNLFNRLSASQCLLKLIAVCLALLMFGCKKDRLETETNTPPPTGENYANTQDFFNRNAMPVQNFSFNSVTGGSFTASQGTMVTVLDSAFRKLNG